MAKMVNIRKKELIFYFWLEWLRIAKIDRLSLYIWSNYWWATAFSLSVTFELGFRNRCIGSRHSTGSALRFSESSLALSWSAILLNCERRESTLVPDSDTRASELTYSSSLCSVLGFCDLNFRATNPSALSYIKINLTLFRGCQSAYWPVWTIQAESS